MKNQTVLCGTFTGWEQVTKEVDALSLVIRAVAEVKQKWFGLKLNTK